VQPPVNRLLDDHLAFEHHLRGRAAWLRAAVLGANDGSISIASLIVGIAGASAEVDELGDAVGDLGEDLGQRPLRPADPRDLCE